MVCLLLAAALLAGGLLPGAAVGLLDPLRPLGGGGLLGLPGGLSVPVVFLLIALALPGLAGLPLLDRFLLLGGALLRSRLFRLLGALALVGLALPLPARTAAFPPERGRQLRRVTFRRVTPSVTGVCSTMRDGAVWSAEAAGWSSSGQVKAVWEGSREKIRGEVP
jgi:hypothetical protein